MTRAQRRALSNNASNPDKNICALRVAYVLGVSNSVRYLHTYFDLKRACSTRFSVRSVKSMAKASTVSGARQNLARITDALAFIVLVEGHVILLEALTGKTLVDTAPRKIDKRKILAIHGIYGK